MPYTYPVLLTSEDPEVVRFLRKLNKSALIDIVTQSIAALEGQLDEPISIEQLRDHAEPVLRVRGDRVP